MTAKDDIRKEVIKAAFEKHEEIYEEMPSIYNTIIDVSIAETLAAVEKAVGKLDMIAIIGEAGKRYYEQEDADERTWAFLIIEETQKDVLAKLKEMEGWDHATTSR